jgi:hypothetical protein
MMLSCRFDLIFGVLTPLSAVLTDKISQQPENCENRNDRELVQAFLKKLVTPRHPFHVIAYNQYIIAQTSSIIT